MKKLFTILSLLCLTMVAQAQSVTTWDTAGDPVTFSDFMAAVGTGKKYAFRMPASSKRGWCNFTSMAAVEATNLTIDDLFSMEVSTTDNTAYKLKRFKDGKYLSGDDYSTSWVDEGAATDLYLNNRTPSAYNDPEEQYYPIDKMADYSISVDNAAGNHFNNGNFGFKPGTGGWSAYFAFGPLYVITVKCVDEHGDEVGEPLYFFGLDGATFSVTAPKFLKYNCAEPEATITVNGADEEHTFVYTHTETFDYTLSVINAPEGTKLKIFGQEVDITATEYSSVTPVTSDNVEVIFPDGNGSVPLIYVEGVLITVKCYPATAILNEVNFPDANFRAALVSELGINEGDVITDEMVAATTSLNVVGRSITDLTGIEHFTALTSLDCYRNLLTSLDVSKNTALTRLQCYGNQLTSLDVSKNTALTELNCYSNLLTSLDVSKNTALTTLYCRNNQLTSLDVSKNTALTTLFCLSNLLTSLNVSGCTALTTLYSYGNQLTSLDVSGCTALRNFGCDNNKLTSLDVSQNTALIEFWCKNNRLTSLDLSNLTQNMRLYISMQQLTAEPVTLPDGRIGIDIGADEIDWSRVTELKGDGTDITPVVDGKYLIIAESGANYPLSVTYKYDTRYPIRETMMEVQIAVGFFSVILLNEENFPDANFRAALAEKFNIVEGAELHRVHLLTTELDVNGQNKAENKKIADLTGIEHFTVLETLSAYDNQLTSLDVSKNTALTELRCNYNQLTSLDVSQNTALKELYCYFNQLTSLDVSGCIALTTLYCRGNQLTSLDLSNQLNNLSSRQVSTQYRTAKAVKLADGRIGIDLGVSGIDAARFVNLERDYVGMDAVVSGNYLIIADNVNKCPNWVTYEFDTNYPVETLLMYVVIDIDKSDLALLVLLDNDEGEAYNNSLRIADHVGEMTYVVIDGRKLQINGNWNTVCLPFGMSADDLNGWTVKELVGSTYTAATKTLTLDFANATEMVAGKPYLIRKTESAGETMDFEFDNRTISDAPAVVVETECVDFVGLYSTFDIAQKDRTLLFMGGDSKLYYPSDAMKIGAFRGYFRLKNGLTAGDVTNGAKEIVLNFGGGEVTGVSSIEHGTLDMEHWYTIDGRKLNGKPTTKGIYVVNGKKVVIK
ncbi:MAG: leucine-rich repeat domain-containing protein [Prevotella sp.]|nr:leucine-rich repeat domain-containing protein [Prevotella sp.]